MTTQTQALTQSGQTTAATQPLVAVIFAAVLGLGIIAVTGHVQASTLHTAAHDVRHATGFPCH